MNKYLEELPDEVLEEIVYEYEDSEEIDVDKIIANLKSNISDYLFYNPDDSIPEEPGMNVDYDFNDDYEMSIELIEKIEPKDDIVDKRY